LKSEIIALRDPVILMHGPNAKAALLGRAAFSIVIVRWVLSAILDDASRLIPHAQFYGDPGLGSLLDCFHAGAARDVPVLMIVRPETVIDWQRRRFKRYWWKLSQPKKPGCPRVPAEVRTLVRTMVDANPL